MLMTTFADDAWLGIGTPKSGTTLGIRGPRDAFGAIAGHVARLANNKLVKAVH